MSKFFITPSVFWEVENDKGRFVIAWLIFHLTFYFHLDKAGEEE